MNLFNAIILATLQGITEFLPISSSAHLILLPKIMDIPEQTILFDIVLHGGTLMAVIIYYNKQLFQLIKKKELLKNILLATLPSIFIGLFVEKYLLYYFKSLYIISFMLTSIGIVFIFADKKIKNQNAINKDINKLSLTTKKAVIIGFAQPIAFIRGTSRSGITTIVGLYQNLNIYDALNFSFLLSIPTIALAFFYELLKLILKPNSFAYKEPTSLLIISFFVSFIIGLLAIKFMLKIIPQIGFKAFGIYRMILGLVILSLLIYG